LLEAPFFLVLTRNTMISNLEDCLMFDLYIGNKNYSSWSLRAWLLMRELDIAFNEHQFRFGASEWRTLAAISPSGKVPCLVDGGTSIWDSLAITEHLAESYAVVWPAERPARAFARSAAAEMHSGFAALRSGCPMSCGVRMRLHETSTSLNDDIVRIQALWSTGLSRFGGPFLAGEHFTAVDAFFAPIAFRVQTYGLALNPASLAYVSQLLGLGGMRAWYADALQETFRDEPHEKEILTLGDVVEDFRAL
jgi:glutathione S-transferase